jgi:hypothetical protein
MKATNKKANEEVSKRFQPLDRAELILGGFLKDGYIPSGHLAMGNNGFYYAGDLRYISYRKIRHDDEKIALMQQQFEDLFCLHRVEEKPYQIFSFMHVRKNYEQKITKALTACPESLSYFWERWCIFKNGTILEPRLAERFIEKLKIQDNLQESEEDAYLELLLSKSK